MAICPPFKTAALLGVPTLTFTALFSSPSCPKLGKRWQNPFPTTLTRYPGTCALSTMSLSPGGPLLSTKLRPGDSQSRSLPDRGTNARFASIQKWGSDSARYVEWAGEGAKSR
eukprot:2135577-Rhodomonas_salina.1